MIAERVKRETAGSGEWQVASGHECEREGRCAMCYSALDACALAWVCLMGYLWEWIGPGGLHSLQNCCALRRVAQVGSTPMRSRPLLFTSSQPIIKSFTHQAGLVKIFNCVTVSIARSSLAGHGTDVKIPFCTGSAGIPVNRSIYWCLHIVKLYCIITHNRDSDVFDVFV